MYRGLIECRLAVYVLTINALPIEHNRELLCD